MSASSSGASSSSSPAPSSSAGTRASAARKPALTGAKRYKKGRSFADTLFGKIRYGKDLVTGEWVAIKESKRWFAENKISLKGDPVPEDLAQEIKVHQFLMSQADVPESILKLLDVVHDDVYTYLIFELVQNGDFFAFIQENHKLMQVAEEKRCKEKAETEARDSSVDVDMADLRISSASPKPLTKSELKSSSDLVFANWIESIGRLIADVVSAVHWMHSKRVCHLDISLENALISGSGRIKLIDFGLSREFPLTAATGFRLKERCGKSRCMAPEVHRSEWYDARAADVWSIGVMLFMMLLGVPPWTVPDTTEMIYRMVMCGRLRDVIVYNKKRHFVNDQILDLLVRFFKAEAQRLTLEQVRNHPFIVACRIPATAS